MLTGDIAIGGGGCGKILPWVTVGNGNCCDNYIQVRGYYVESVYVERSIELDELEGQLELDCEIQLIVALLGS